MTVGRFFILRYRNGHRHGEKFSCAYLHLNRNRIRVEEEL
jgi:hypothetical protein